MTLSNIIKNICSQLGDPNADTYAARAKDHLERAIFTLIDKKEYTEDDISGYMKLKTDLQFTGGEADISALDILRIHNIFPNPTVQKELIITLKNISEIGKIASNTNLQPSTEDLFIYRVGETLYHIKSDDSNFSTGDTLYMAYIEDIDTSVWTDATSLSADFSNLFINKSIALAVQTLKEEEKLTEALT